MRWNEDICYTSIYVYIDWWRWSEIGFLLYQKFFFCLLWRCNKSPPLPSLTLSLTHREEAKVMAIRGSLCVIRRWMTWLRRERDREERIANGIAFTLPHLSGLSIHSYTHLHIYIYISILAVMTELAESQWSPGFPSINLIEKVRHHTLMIYYIYTCNIDEERLWSGQLSPPHAYMHISLSLSIYIYMCVCMDVCRSIHTRWESFSPLSHAVVDLRSHAARRARESTYCFPFVLPLHRMFFVCFRPSCLSILASIYR